MQNREEKEFNSDRRSDLDFMRLVLTVLVVVGHSTYYSIDTMFGGIYVAELMEYSGIRDTVFHAMASKLTSLIYSFHMPAYFALSGVVFWIQYKGRKYSDLKDIVKEKIRRILLPCLFVWFCWNVPIKMLSGYYSRNDKPALMALLQIFFPYCVYLWFLEALFCIFILAFLLLEHIKGMKKQIAVVSVCFCVGICVERWGGAWVPLGNPLKYLFWFYCGICMENRDMKDYFWHGTVRKMAFYSALFAGFYCLNAKMVSQYFIFKLMRFTLWQVVLPFMGIVWLWSCAVLVEGKLGAYWRKLLRKVVAYTYGVYLYAEPLNYLILYLAMARGGYSVWRRENIRMDLHHPLHWHYVYCTGHNKTVKEVQFFY